MRLVLTIGLCPSVLHFATVVEYHGLAFGGFGLAWLAWANGRNRPGPGNATLYGMATACAAGLHSHAHLLPLLGVGWWLADRLRWSTWRPALVALLVHAIASRSLSELLRDPASPPFGLFVADWPALLWLAASRAPPVVWREWFVAYPPVCLGALVATLRRAGSPGLTPACGAVFVVGWLLWTAPAGLNLQASTSAAPTSRRWRSSGPIRTTRRGTRPSRAACSRWRPSNRASSSSTTGRSATAPRSCSHACPF